MEIEHGPNSSTENVPADLCGYAVVSELAAGHSYLAIGPGGRGVALKKLEPDCLLNDRLHPLIRDRLQRVRELAHPGIANLHGVEWDGQQAWLIWEYIEGKPLSAFAAEHCKSPQTLAALWRELVLAVQTLHAQGIVHGSVSDANIIVSPTGLLRLTHVSPYLYSDPNDDAEALLDLLRDEAPSPSGVASPALAIIVQETAPTAAALHRLAVQLGIFSETPDPPAAPLAAARKSRPGWRTIGLWAGAAIVLLAIAVCFALWRFSR